jgi:DNA-binding NtrC family response regulator
MEVQQLIPQRSADAGRVSSEARRATVFVVDDEPMVGEVVVAVLGMEGYETRLFTSPVDAWEAFESAETKPDLLISDLVMAPFDGVELMGRCQALVPSLRTILYSGCKGFDAISPRGRLPDAFLNKPFLPKELLQTVEAALAD